MTCNLTSFSTTVFQSYQDDGGGGGGGGGGERVNNKPCLQSRKEFCPVGNRIWRHYISMPLSFLRREAKKKMAESLVFK